MTEDPSVTARGVGFGASGERGAASPGGARSTTRPVLERLARDHSIPLASMISMGMVVIAMLDAARSMETRGQQRRTLTAARVACAAEEAAFAAAVPGTPNPTRIRTSWGMTVQVERVRDRDERLELAVATGRGHERFACDWLRGSAPRCLQSRLTLGGDGFPSADDRTWIHGVVSIGNDSLPQLAPTDRARATLPELSCDTEVAFLHLPGGTDRSDFTLGGGCEQIAVPPATQVVEVRGNLWVLPAAQPLWFVLRAPLTIIVHGNLYLGRSIEVVGRGPLTLVAHRTGPTFRDLDGDGACANGETILGGSGTPAIEGDGSVYLGIPRQTARPPVGIAAHIVAGGEIHVLTSARVHGALVGAHGLTACNARAELHLTGRCLRDVTRTRVPGFATSGSPRPGLLERAAPEPR